MKSDQYDPLDLRILHALHLDARVPFAQVAAVLDVSDQTVARRYTRLRSEGGLRIRGLADPARLGRVEWVVRIRCPPDSAAAVAAALARRPDTSWISRTSGGTELVCVTQAPTPADELLLKSLPRTARLLDVSAHCLLHTFCGRAGGVVSKLDALTPEQAAHLRPPEPDPGGPVTPDDVDHHLLALLRADGRAPAGRLAAETGVSYSTVQRRIADLRSSGVLYFDVDTERARLGVHVRTLLWLTVPPARLEATGAALASHPEVAFAAAIAGDRALFASVATPGIAGFYAYLTGTVATLPDVLSLESSLVLHTVKGPDGG
ncbi:Lrp/AsnC family transcriptional regulator [Amycolatopsis sp. OK19-0408]|uniref:Lrp/AsnC family transcriptional regulator n=1 Tax=Amycolatopsis iheyensis TaxID=2945988 RepID=A0A9X2SP30_9PSEU|nr:Lrp/AsnC family transcriptional regulator [Amycolatopsis iheyensis]MCR6487751.1 Lrp/AsnC family transcriptional regulator [Amycolatopsis iheyensis]